MKTLFLSNFYPPVSRGGFEQWCQEVADELRSQGHDVLVLTSTYGCEALAELDPVWVRRELFLEMEFLSLQNALLFFTSRKKREAQNLARLHEIIESYAPDVILIWGMWNFPRSLAALAEKLMPGKVVYYMGDYWPTLPSQFENYWDSPARNMMTGIPKALLKPFAKRILEREEKPDLCLDHVLFPSLFMRDEFERKGVRMQSAQIVYGAIDTGPYSDHPRSQRQPSDIISLLYIGRLTHEKGVHTAIESVGHLAHEHGFKNLKLTIVGDGDANYVSDLRQLAWRENIAAFVTFLPAQPKAVLPGLYHQADIFLFTSVWPEPFGRVIVEAMASGVPVVGTAVGGAAEILNENALTFDPDDSVGLSRQLKRLIESPSLRGQMGKASREIAVNKFDVHRMSTEIESYLQALAS